MAMAICDPNTSVSLPSTTPSWEYNASWPLRAVRRRASAPGRGAFSVRTAWYSPPAPTRNSGSAVSRTAALSLARRTRALALSSVNRWVEA